MHIGVPKEVKNNEYRVGLTPASVVAAANAAVNAAIKEKSVIDSLAVVGLIAKGSTAAEMAVASACLP